MKKILLLILMLSICVGLCSCKTTVNNENSFDFWGKYIVIRSLYNGNYGYLYETYDKDTLVRYDIWKGGYTGGITPVYNSDGTPMLYDEE